MASAPSQLSRRYDCREGIAGQRRQLAPASGSLTRGRIKPFRDLFAASAGAAGLRLSQASNLGPVAPRRQHPPAAAGPSPARTTAPSCAPADRACARDAAILPRRRRAAWGRRGAAAAQLPSVDASAPTTAHHAEKRCPSIPSHRHGIGTSLAATLASSVRRNKFRIRSSDCGQYTLGARESRRPDIVGVTASEESRFRQ